MEAYANQLSSPAVSWDKLPDEEIALLAQKGNQEAEEYLLRKTRRFISGPDRISYRAERRCDSRV